ncbi:MAG: isochorismatase family protein [Myxococcales bacterium]|nr:MAG: isochorismatase family protein [Myxococcales bacterium]
MSTRHLQALPAVQSALVIVDIQERLFATMSPEGQANLLKNTPILIASARELAVPMIVTEQYPKGLGRTIPALQEAIAGLPLVEKVEFAATLVSTFNDLLAKTRRRQVVLCGMESHICVYQTALGLLAQGYGVQVVADALATRDPKNHAIALDLLRQAGCSITCTEAVLFQWLERAGTESFKKLQKLIL